MSKVTSKRQVTVPRAIAEQYGIKPGTELEWVPAGDVIRVIPGGRRQPKFDVATRLELFDASVRRQAERQALYPAPANKTGDRGWTREELYIRRSDDEPNAAD